MKWQTLFEKEPLDIDCKCLNNIIFLDKTNNKRWQICTNCFRKEKINEKI